MTLLDYKESQSWWIEFLESILRNSPSSTYGKCVLCDAPILHPGLGIKSEHCTRCEFWLEWKQIYTDVTEGQLPFNDCMVIGGKLFHIVTRKQEPNKWNKGYFGKTFAIRSLIDQTVLLTDDLWKVEFRYGGFQGDTTPPFAVQDNAEFVGERPSF